MSTCNATLTVISTHVCKRPAGHPLSDSVWGRDVETHYCCGYQWIDTAEGATAHSEDRQESSRDECHEG